MLLSRRDIIEYIKKGEIQIEPFDEKMIGVDTIDLRLGEDILIAENINKTIDPKNPEHYWKKEKIGENGIELKPGSFVLASTMEKIGMGKSIAAFIEGRSSLGRLGIMVHVTAGLAHAGFGELEKSHITLEMYSVNPNPVKLYKGMGIAQLAFIKLSKPAEKAYDEIGKYVGLKGPLPPKPI